MVDFRDEALIISFWKTYLEKIPKATDRARDHLSILTDTFLLFLGVLRERFLLLKFYCLSQLTVLSVPLYVLAFLFFMLEGRGFSEECYLMSSVVFRLFLPVANVLGDKSAKLLLLFMLYCG